MRRYRAAIFRYAILVNVALALFVLWLSIVGIRDYFENLDQWIAEAPLRENGPVFGFDGPTEPRPGQLPLACAMALAALVLMLSSIASVRRRSGWSYWLRILSFLVILCLIWVQTVTLLAFFIDVGASHLIFQNRNSITAMLTALLGSLWLVYNISYRPAAPGGRAPSR